MFLIISKSSINLIYIQELIYLYPPNFKKNRRKMKLFLVITITLALISNTFGSKRSQNCNCQDEIEDLRKENTDRQIEIGLLREQDIEINTELTNMKETQVQLDSLFT